MAEETRPRAHRQTSAHTDRFAHKNVHTQRKCTHKRIGHESEENKSSGIVSFWKSSRTIKLVRKSCLDVNYMGGMAIVQTKWFGLPHIFHHPSSKACVM